VKSQRQSRFFSDVVVPGTVGVERLKTAQNRLGEVTTVPTVPRCCCGEALGEVVWLSYDSFLEEHVMHELRVVRRGRRRLIPVDELERGSSRTP
jgi:hypothetical protein